jgi:hypothetical protein
MREWMELLHKVIEEQKPEQIWSCDEYATLHGHGNDKKTKRRKVIGRKGKKASIKRDMFDEHVSLMLAIEQKGSVAAPFLIFSGKVIL